MVSKVRNFWLCVFSGEVAITLISFSSHADRRLENIAKIQFKNPTTQMTSKLVEGDNPLDFLDSSMIPKIYKGTKKDPCTLPEKDGKFVIEDLAKVTMFCVNFHTF